MRVRKKDESEWKIAGGAARFHALHTSKPSKEGNEDNSNNSIKSDPPCA